MKPLEIDLVAKRIILADISDAAVNILSNKKIDKNLTDFRDRLIYKISLHIQSS